MNVTLTVVGAIFVAVAILGGGLRIGGLEIARMSILRMIMLALLGLIAMGLGWSVEWAAARKDPEPFHPAPVVEQSIIAPESYASKLPPTNAVDRRE